MHFPHHKIETTQVLNGRHCILLEELLINPNNLITISGIDQATMVIWDKDKHTFTEPNDLYNEEDMEGMLEGTGLMALDIYQDPQSVLKIKMGHFDESGLQKYYAWE